LRFNATAAHAGSTLLALSAIGLVVPAVFHHIVASHGETPTGFAHEHELSLEIAIVLFLTYMASLWFSLRTHKHLYAGDSAPADAAAGGRHAHTTAAGHAADKVGGHSSGHGPGWSVRRALLMLLGATALVALMSEFLVGAVEHTAAAFGMTEVFVGVILVAIIGNAAEHSTAILVARKNQMDLALNIAVGSSIQVALFVAPVLVFASYALGRPMDLLFTPFEVLSVVASVFVLNLVCADGEAHWLEGVQLLAVYVILALAFYFLP
jgi:Ca2+:H+ antiporter